MAVNYNLLALQILKAVKENAVTRGCEQKARNKQTYWEAMVRNNYQMPTLKSQIVTIKWMQGI